MLGELEPSAGEVRQGTQLEIARFDQLHGTLDERRTVAENVCGDGDTVFIDGKPKNIYSYLSDFLFTIARLAARLDSKDETIYSRPPPPEPPGSAYSPLEGSTQIWKRSKTDS